MGNLSYCFTHPLWLWSWPGSLIRIPLSLPSLYPSYTTTNCLLAPCRPPTLAKHWHWLRWVLLAFFACMLLALWYWLDWRRSKLVAELGRKDAPPYVWNIHIEGTDEVLVGDSLNSTLQVLRRRGSTNTMLLDLPRSIAATAEKGGMPQFRYRPRTQPVDYLFLLDRQSAQNHRTHLFDALYRTFREQEIEIARFFYDSAMRILQ